MSMLRNDTYKPWFEGEDWGVEIIDGEYSGVIVQFKSLEFSAKDDGTVDVDFHIINQPQGAEIDTKSDMFNNTIEIIINDILKEAISLYEQTRNNDTPEPD
jgi:hypothetical protein